MHDGYENMGGGPTRQINSLNNNNLITCTGFTNNKYLGSNIYLFLHVFPPKSQNGMDNNY